MIANDYNISRKKEKVEREVMLFNHLLKQGNKKIHYDLVEVKED